MTYPRVNLLKKSEQRHQGAVSRRFILISVVITPVLIIAVLSGIKLVQYTGVQSNLKTSREIWKDLEPKLTQFNEEQRHFDSSRKVLSLIDGWEASQPPLDEIMSEIQAVVPVNVQFNRLYLRGDIAPAVYAAAEEMPMNFQMQIEGVAEGTLAEEDIWQFHKDLLGAVTVGNTFDAIELSDMRKKQSTTGGNAREFRIQGANTQEGTP